MEKLPFPYLLLNIFSISGFITKLSSRYCLICNFSIFISCLKGRENRIFKFRNAVQPSRWLHQGSAQLSRHVSCYRFLRPLFSFAEQIQLQVEQKNVIIQFRNDMDEMRVVSRRMQDLEKYHALSTRKSRPANLHIWQVYNILLSNFFLSSFVLDENTNTYHSHFGEIFLVLRFSFPFVI